MIRLEPGRLLMLNSEGVQAAAVAEFLATNRHFFEPWTAKVDDDFYTTAFWQKGLEKNIMLETQGTQFVFFVFMKDNPLHITGKISLSQISRGPFQSCYLGYMTAEKYTRKGVMTEAIPEVIKFAFTTLHLHRVEANIMPHNIASIKLVEKLGFNYEGLALKYLQINGVWEDHQHYAIRNSAVE